MPTPASVTGLVRALDATGELIAGVGTDQWSEPTPCPEWTVRQLINHMVFGNQLFADTVRGDPPPMDRLMQLRTLDHLGDDPVGAYRKAAEALQAAFSQPGVLEQVFQAPIGAVPGAVMLHLRTTETLVHGWDLAKATGQPARLPDDVAEEELAFSRGMLEEKMARSSSFGPPQPAPDDAPASSRLAAYLGRSL